MPEIVREHLCPCNTGTFAECFHHLPDIWAVKRFSVPWNKYRAACYFLLSDRGSQYTAFSFRQLLDSLNIVQSFSKKGYPFDNACCECFFKYLKKEETNLKCYHSLTELQLSVFEYIKGITTQKDHTECLIWLRQMKRRLYIGNRLNSLFPHKNCAFYVYLLDYGSVQLDIFYGPWYPAESFTFSAAVSFATSVPSFL